MTNSTDLFLIIGATGNTGAHTVRLLREGGHRVRAFVHTLDQRSARLAEQGAEVVVGDLHDFPTVSAAITGVTAAYFNYPVAPGLVEATATFAQAASEAGVHAVVNMSQISGDDFGALFGQPRRTLIESVHERANTMTAFAQ